MEQDSYYLEIYIILLNNNSFKEAENKKDEDSDQNIPEKVIDENTLKENQEIEPVTHIQEEIADQNSSNLASEELDDIVQSSKGSKNDEIKSEINASFDKPDDQNIVYQIQSSQDVSIEYPNAREEMINVTNQMISSSAKSNSKQKKDWSDVTNSGLKNLTDKNAHDDMAVQIKSEAPAQSDNNQTVQKVPKIVEHMNPMPAVSLNTGQPTPNSNTIINNNNGMLNLNDEDSKKQLLKKIKVESDKSKIKQEIDDSKNQKLGN